MRLSGSAALVLLAALCGSSCHRSRPHPVERVEIVSVDDWEGAAHFGFAPQEALRLLREQLAQDRRFRLLLPDEQGSDEDCPARLSLGIGAGAGAQDDGESGGGSLELRLIARCKGEDGTPIRLDAFSDLKIPDLNAPGHLTQARNVLARSLLDAKEQTFAQLEALRARDAILVKQLISQDENTREAALRILTLRRNGAAVPIWIERLTGPDPVTVRQAIGALIEIKDPRATPALIDLARRKDQGFLREIIFALEAIGGDEAKGYLYTMAQGHEDAPVREAAQAALKGLEESQARDAPGESTRAQPREQPREQQ